MGRVTVALMGRKSEEQKQADAAKKEEEAAARAEAKAAQDELNQQAAAALAAHVANLPKWEYKVIRVGEDKQKGILGSGRMETLFNDLGKSGWELVSVNEERASFKRMRRR
jgi:hypothetical protein